MNWQIFVVLLALIIPKVRLFGENGTGIWHSNGKLFEIDLSITYIWVVGSLNTKCCVSSL